MPTWVEIAIAVTVALIGREGVAALWTAIANARKTSADTHVTESASLRETNAALAKDNARLRSYIAQFDEELRQIRQEMLALRQEYEVEIAALRQAQDAEREQWSTERQRLYQCIEALTAQLINADLIPCCRPGMLDFMEET